MAKTIKYVLLVFGMALLGAGIFIEADYYWEPAAVLLCALIALGFAGTIDALHSIAEEEK